VTSWLAAWPGGLNGITGFTSLPPRRPPTRNASGRPTGSWLLTTARSSALRGRQEVCSTLSRKASGCPAVIRVRRSAWPLPVVGGGVRAVVDNEDPARHAANTGARAAHRQPGEPRNRGGAATTCSG